MRANATNLIEPESGEAIAHQWTKSLFYNRTMSQQMQRLFNGVDAVSLTKLIRDVKIFDLLFALRYELLQRVQTVVLPL